MFRAIGLHEKLIFFVSFENLLTTEDKKLQWLQPFFDLIAHLNQYKDGP